MLLQLARRASLTLAAGILLAGAAQAQSISVKVEGRTPAAVRTDIGRAAVRVCRQDNTSPLAPLAEAGCVDDTVAASLDKLAALRAHAQDLSAARPARPPGGER